MNTRMKIAVVLAGISGILLAAGGAYAYAQSTTQQSSPTSCGSMNHNVGMGMMGGMSHYGSMNQSQCNSHMGHQSMGQCRDMMASRDPTQPYTMMDQNMTSVCY